METRSKIQANEGEGVPASTLDANKQTVVSFYELALDNKDFEAASKLIGPRLSNTSP